MAAIFITGANGFLGSYLLREVSARSNHDIYLVIRAGNDGEASQRLVRQLSRFCSPAEIDRCLKRTRIFSGDITKHLFGLGQSLYNELAKSVEVIFHAAALTDFTAPWEQMQLVNVEGTRETLRFADKCSLLKYYNYVSTVFVAGNFEGVYSEDDFEVGQRFNNYYEKSKFEAEKIVRQVTSRGIKATIFRPSIIMGEFSSGKLLANKMFIQSLTIFYQEFFKAVPVYPKCNYNIVPVDSAARSIFKLGMFEDSHHTYHIVGKDTLFLGEIIDYLIQYLGLDEIEYVSINDFRKIEKSAVKRRLVEPFVPYYNLKHSFSSEITFRDLAHLRVSADKIDMGFVKRTVDYCVENKLLRKIVKA